MKSELDSILLEEVRSKVFYRNRNKTKKTMYAVLFKRFSAAAMFLCMLSGCSISPALDAASWTVDGVSYLITGKAAMDHAVSAMAGQDCKMIRMIKKEMVCVPRDGDVAGDQLVFKFEKSWTVAPADQIDAGDPLRVNPAIADILQPLGTAILVETRSTTVAAVAADPVPIRAMLKRGEEPDSWTSVISGFVKNKPVMPVGAPDEATRLWLEVE